MSNVQLFLVFVLSASGPCEADPETVYGTKGSSIIFDCPYKSTSLNNVRWLYVFNTSTFFTISEGTGVSTSSPVYNRVSVVGDHTLGQYNLQLGELQKSDDVVYRCSVGMQQKKYKLELIAVPSSITIQNVTDNKILGLEGQSLTLRCTADGGKPPPLVTITVNNVPRSGVQSTDYIIPTLQRGHDKQIVLCDANSSALNSPLVATATLYLYCAPQTPLNFTILTSTESSIIVQWEAGYNGGHEQTFYLQFRRFGSSAWVAVKIPDTKQSGMQTYTLSELQDGILFELVMYAENMVKKGLPTETKTIATIKDSRLSSSEAIIKGVAGSMSAVIFIMCIIIARVILWKKGKNRPKSKAQYSSWKEETAYSIPMDVKETDENTDTVNKRGKHIRTITGSAKEYEILGMKDNPNTYSEILSKQGQQQSEKSAQEYETLGTVDNPNIYSALNSQSAQPSSEYTNIEI